MEMIDLPNTPRRCPICGNLALLEFCEPKGIALCPRCRTIIQWFHESFGFVPDRITPETPFYEMGDSLDILELQMELEEEFGVKIPFKEEAGIKTIGDAIRYIDKHLPGNRA